MVSLENEYCHYKCLLENAQAKMEKMQNLDVSKMTSEQIEARDRVISYAKEEIQESQEILEEIEEEIRDLIANGDEVSEYLLQELGDKNEKNIKKTF